MEFAASPLEIKALDDSGSIEGLLAGFDDLDSHSDRISSKAFNRTLAERGARPLPMLLHHDINRPVGTWREFKEVPEGLYARGRLTLETRDAQEAHALAKDGALGGLSIGYKTRQAHIDQRSGERHLLDLDLFEGSLVTIASNPNTRVVSVKSIASARDIADMLRDGGLSGRQAKAAAGAAWRTLNESDDETKAVAAVEASIARLTGKGI